MDYKKPYLTYDEQLALLTSRGLACGSRGPALEALERIGYYRLGAYLYPMRQFLPLSQRTTKLQFRDDNFQSGATLDDGIQLADFDGKLRHALLIGLAEIETLLRSHIAYVLGRRGRWAHLERGELDSDAGYARPPGRSTAGDAFEDWVERYDSLVDRAHKEDFIQHYRAKYSTEVPIWMAVEVLDFGNLVRLYRLLQKSDQNEVARKFGFSNGRVLDPVLQGFNDLRNWSAHHSRVWNRQIRTMAQFHVKVIGADLHHAASSPDRDRLYVWIAAAVYMVKAVRPGSQWPLTIRTTLRKFPATQFWSLASIGFPPDWESLDLWRS